MCEFCEEPTKNLMPHRQFTDSNITEMFLHGENDGYALFIRQSPVVHIGEDAEMTLSQINDYVYLDIKYCPICGRKL